MRGILYICAHSILTHILSMYINTIYIMAFQSRLAIAASLKYQLHGYVVVKSLSPTITFDAALRSIFRNLFPSMTTL